MRLGQGRPLFQETQNAPGSNASLLTPETRRPRPLPTTFVGGILIAFLLGLPSFGTEPLVFPETVDLGKLVSQKEATTTIIGRNRSAEPVCIERVRTSCGCSDAEFDKDPIPPGAETTLIVNYTPGTRIGERRKTIRVYLKGRKRPCVIALTADVIDPDGQDNAEETPEKARETATSQPRDPEPDARSGNVKTVETQALGHHQEAIVTEQRKTGLPPTTSQHEAPTAATDGIASGQGNLISVVGLVFAPNLILLGAGAWVLRRKR